MEKMVWKEKLSRISSETFTVRNPQLRNVSSLDIGDGPNHGNSFYLHPCTPGQSSNLNTSIVFA